MTEWPILSCTCGYAVELCQKTTGYSLCPLCLRHGKNSPLERKISRV